jgi:uncharacterized protein (DUF302 family)
MFTRPLRGALLAGFLVASSTGACASAPAPSAPTTSDASAQVELWVEIEGQGSVDKVVDRFVAVVTEAGLHHFTTIDHGAGAQAVGMELGAMKLVIFGNPKVGSRLMASDSRVGQELPLRVLIRESGGGVVRVGFVTPLSFAARYDLATVSDTLAAMDKALRKFAAAALAP